MKRVICGVAMTLAAISASLTTVNTAPASAVPTFAKDVAPIIFDKCAGCHRPGEIGPMPLLSYEDARPWAKAIKIKVVGRDMPPWGADHEQTLPMRNDRSLTERQIQTIAAWVDGGTPRGNDADMPAAPSFADGWAYGREPD